MFDLFDLWPTNSDQFFLESSWTFAPNLKKFPQSVLNVSRYWDVPENTSPPSATVASAEASTGRKSKERKEKESGGWRYGWSGSTVQSDLCAAN